MAEYIEREKIIAELYDISGCDADADTWADGWDKAIDVAIVIAERLSAADVEPIKHGHWIFKERIKLVPTGRTVVAEDKTALILRKL